MSASSDRITRLLRAIDRGESGAVEELLPLVYDELRSRAGKLMAGERVNHTLQRTALVHEAYLDLAGGELSFQSRAHFFNAAGLAMRRILVRHATRRGRLKRGGGRARLNLDEIDIADDCSAEMDWLELDEALNELERVSPRRHQVVMLRFFSGRTEAEVAQMLDVSEATVRRDWVAARSWLYLSMTREK
jgi:RNA polymerase sigma factor (TIGR02999 family)